LEKFAHVKQLVSIISNGVKKEKLSEILRKMGYRVIDRLEGDGRGCEALLLGRCKVQATVFCSFDGCMIGNIIMIGN
jgi:hypothetical protein